jgi:hypothetical protein
MKLGLGLIVGLVQGTRMGAVSACGAIGTVGAVGTVQRRWSGGNLASAQHGQNGGLARARLIWPVASGHFKMGGLHYGHGPSPVKPFPLFHIISK